jgi:hypothetical protein
VNALDDLILDGIVLEIADCASSQQFRSVKKHKANGLTSVVVGAEVLLPRDGSHRICGNLKARRDIRNSEKSL